MSSLADNNLLGIIKKIVLDVIEASKPVQVVFGTVTEPSPIKIQISQKLILNKNQLAITKTAFDSSLKAGDKVVMLRMQEGQRYIVIDKVVKL